MKRVLLVLIPGKIWKESTSNKQRAQKGRVFIGQGCTLQREPGCCWDGTQSHWGCLCRVHTKRTHYLTANLYTTALRAPCTTFTLPCRNILCAKKFLPAVVLKWLSEALIQDCSFSSNSSFLKYDCQEQIHFSYAKELIFWNSSRIDLLQGTAPKLYTTSFI